MLSKAQVRLIRQDVACADEQLPLLFGAMSDMGRYRIFKLLLRHDGLCVTDVARVLGISVPAASQQLKIMEMSGLIRKERMGQMICYSIKRDEPKIRALMRMLASYD